MRKFTDQENKWIKNFVEHKEKGLSHVQELQVAKILRTEFSFFALKWTYGDKPQISLYNREEDKDKLEKQYYNICDFIYFIKELESLGFIAIQKSFSRKENAELSILYDRDKYIYNETSNKFEPKENVGLESINTCSSGKKILLEKSDNGVSLWLEIRQTQNINLDFAYDLQKYGLGIIYPLPLVVDYVNNDFKTLEERYHEAEIDLALKSVKWSQIAAVIAFTTLVLSVLFDIL